MNQDSHSDEKQERLKEKLRDELGPVIVGLLDRSSGLEDILVNEDSRIWVKRTGAPFEQGDNHRPQLIAQLLFEPFLLLVSVRVLVHRLLEFNLIPALPLPRIAMYIPIQTNVTPFRVILANPVGRRSVMDRTRNAVERMLAALDAPAYDLGILSERGMLPGLSHLTAAGVFSRLLLLKAHNARGAHIYIRAPSSS